MANFGFPLRKAGIATGGFRCPFKILPPMMRCAATCIVRSTDPPVAGSRYVEGNELLQRIFALPAPIVVVPQDINHRPGAGVV